MAEWRSISPPSLQLGVVSAKFRWCCLRGSTLWQFLRILFLCQLCPFFFMSLYCSLGVDVSAGALVTTLDLQRKASPRNGGVKSGRSLGPCVHRTAILPRAAFPWASGRQQYTAICLLLCSLTLPGKYNPDRHIVQRVHFKCRGDNLQSGDWNGESPWGKASLKNMWSWPRLFYFLIFPSSEPFPKHDNTFSLLTSFCSAFPTSSCPSCFIIILSYIIHISISYSY